MIPKQTKAKEYPWIVYSLGIITLYAVLYFDYKVRRSYESRIQLRSFDDAPLVDSNRGCDMYVKREAL